jgi:AraC-like DNA-binding protein
MATGIIYPENPFLREHIEYFWYLSSEGKSKPGSTILPPEPRSDILFNFAGMTSMETAENVSMKFNGCFFLSIRKEKFIITSPGNVDYLAVRFYPHALYKILKIPMSEFSALPALEMELINKEFWSSLAGKLYDMNNTSDRIKYLESELLKFLTHDEDSRESRLLKSALEQINFTSGKINIDLLAKQYEVGPKKLERMFSRYVGVSPKSFCGIIRFTRLFNFLEKVPNDINWTSVAYESGYYDQAHMIREFTKYVGYSPEKYLRIKDTLCC